MLFFGLSFYLYIIRRSLHVFWVRVSCVFLPSQFTSVETHLIHTFQMSPAACRYTTDVPPYTISPDMNPRSKRAALSRYIWHIIPPFDWKYIRCFFFPLCLSFFFSAFFAFCCTFELRDDLWCLTRLWRWVWGVFCTGWRGLFEMDAGV